jgi:hypothetical protein
MTDRTAQHSSRLCVRGDNSNLSDTSLKPKSSASPPPQPQQFLFNAFSVGNRPDAYPLSMLYSERAGPIATGASFFRFLFCFCFSVFFVFLLIIIFFETVLNSKHISNGTNFQLLNRF